jgi:WD40 repeat protein
LLCLSGQDEHLALGLEDGTARIHDAATGAEIRKIEAHDKRVKGLKAVPSPLAEDAYWLVTVSSDGSVKVTVVGTKGHC